MKYLVLLMSLMALTACQQSGNGKFNNSSARIAKTPDEYCLGVGGEVKTVGEGSEIYCALPNGKVMEINEFFKTFHR